MLKKFPSNRLASESSPYLLQHGYNPVDWYPWGDEALKQASLLNKPILLSIGYSACHWCHVMAHECFENEEIARFMNEHFINIKVDREERPDLDQIYQNVAQALTRGGGWPLTVFLTPDLRPFYGGTYFPPEDRYGRPGFPRVLRALTKAYESDRPSIEENAVKLTEVIGSMESLPVSAEGSPPQLPTEEAIQKVAEEVLSYFDWNHGGMGTAPKFPNPMILAFLWRVSRVGAERRKVNSEPGKTEESVVFRARAAVLLTLKKMAYGGIYDQLGGGFHRYSVDGEWSVPHFEKMLYDNALLLKLYAEVLLSGEVENKDLFLSVLRETTDYLLREMQSPEGGFYSAQDADSEGEEGTFFVWDLADLKEYLEPDEAQAIATYYGVTETGNFEHGKTVLHRAEGVPRNVEDSDLLERAKNKLLKIRSQGVRVGFPGLDDKLLVSWNALAVSGLAWASQALRLHGQVEVAREAQLAAERAYHFVSVELGRPDGGLSSTYHRNDFRKNSDANNENTSNKGKGAGYLDDYAFMAMAALDLARLTPVSSGGSNQVAAWTHQAQTWVDIILKHFKDSKGLSYFFTRDDQEPLIHRPKTVFDQAIPSGAAVALTAMAALVEVDAGSKSQIYLQEIESQLGGLFALAQQSPQGMGELLCFSLLQVRGAIGVSGVGADRLCVHPHVFRKGDEPMGMPPAESHLGSGLLVVCHQRTCSMPFTDWKQAELEVQRCLVG